jgi:hypothetical protein
VAGRTAKADAAAWEPVTRRIACRRHHSGACPTSALGSAERVAQAITLSDRAVSDDLMARLERQFGDDAIAELTALIAFQNMSSELNAALGVPPQGFCSVIRTAPGEAITNHPIDPVARGLGRRIGEASKGRMP